MNCRLIKIVITGSFLVSSSLIVEKSLGSEIIRLRESGESSQRDRDYADHDYSDFSHIIKHHRLECGACHLLPTANWPQVKEYPDVANYPNHNACSRCHQFSSAPRSFCTNCHFKSVLPLRTSRTLPFPDPRRLREFTPVFPHNLHADVIAMLPPYSARKRETLSAHGSIKSATKLENQDKVSRYYECGVCHETSVKTDLDMPLGGWPSSGLVNGFVTPDMTSPTTHARCFMCHYKGPEPTARNCEGCHRLSVTSNRAPRSRISAKFIHEGGGEKKQHIGECTTCHINTTKATSLQGLKPDVPIASCAECHNKYGLKEDLNAELIAIDKNRSFTCSYCHKPNVGSLDPPASHYLIAERPPIKRRDLK